MVVVVQSPIFVRAQRAVETAFRQANHSIATRGRCVLIGAMTTPASPSRFQCLRTHQIDGGMQTRLESIALDELSAGELGVRTRYACINYKDSP